MKIGYIIYSNICTQICGTMQFKYCIFFENAVCNTLVLLGTDAATMLLRNLRKHLKMKQLQYRPANLIAK